MSYAITLTKHLVVSGIAALVCVAPAWADSPQENVRDGKEPRPDAVGVIPQKIIHRTAPPQISTISPFGQAPSQGLKGAQPPAGSTKANSFPIKYHGGPVMAGVSKVVLIWYGNWGQNNGTDTSAGQQLIRDAVYGLAADATTINATDYSGVTTTANAVSGYFARYTQYGGSPVSQVSSTTIYDCTQPAASAYGGTQLTDATVLSLVQQAANSACSASAVSAPPPGSSNVTGTGASPDASAIYLVLSSSDIAETSGFLTKYCGWHSYSTMSGSIPVKYGFIGNPSASIGSCTYQTTASPNNNPGVDAMVSVIAHELEETVTDPQLNAWYNLRGSENGDMCAWTFGAHQVLLTNGSYYNAVLPTQNNTGTAYYLVQRALSAKNSACYISANPVWQ